MTYLHRDRFQRQHGAARVFSVDLAQGGGHSRGAPLASSHISSSTTAMIAMTAAQGLRVLRRSGFSSSIVELYAQKETSARNPVSVGREQRGHHQHRR